jgi:hypothetical protein
MLNGQNGGLRGLRLSGLGVDIGGRRSRWFLRVQRSGSASEYQEYYECY